MSKKRSRLTKNQKLSQRLKQQQFAQKATKCCICTKEMFFTNHETAPQFLARIKDRGRLAERTFLLLREATLDHNKDLSRVGASEIANARIICRLCNEILSGANSSHGVTDWKNHE